MKPPHRQRPKAKANRGTYDFLGNVLVLLNDAVSFGQEALLLKVKDV